MQLYQLLFPNGKKYIGITSKTAKERFVKHCSKHSCCVYLKRAIEKYGKENVVITVLAVADDWELLCLAEQEAIEKFNTAAPNGYNITLGGNGIYGLTMNSETKHKMSNYAKNRTATHRYRISLSNKGRIHTAISKQNMTESALQREKAKREQKELKLKQELSDKATIRVKRLLREWAEIL